MTGNATVDAVQQILGFIMILSTLIGLFAPKGSKVGAIAAKIGADLKGQTISVHSVKAEEELQEQGR